MAKPIVTEPEAEAPASKSAWTLVAGPDFVPSHLNGGEPSFWRVVLERAGKQRTITAPGNHDGQMHVHKEMTKLLGAA